MKVWKVVAGIVMVLLGCQDLFSQEYGLFSSAYSTERLVYKIPAATADDGSYISTAFFKRAVPVDTMSIYKDVEIYLNNQAYGHYVFVTVYRNELFFNYYQHSPFRVAHIEDGDVLRFRVFNDENEELTNLAAVHHRQIAFYDYEEDCYRFKKDFQESKFSIINALDTFYYSRTGSYGGREKGKHQDERINKGIVLLNKPKYRHGDTLKMAAYLKRKNGKAFTKDLQAIISTGYRPYSYGASQSVLGALSPEKPGLYLFEMVISDTLQLDRTYYLHLDDGKRNSSLNLMKSFKVEDYRLDESRTDVRVKQSSIGTEGPVDFEIISKDANGQGLRGATARVKISPETIENLEDSNLYLPLLWYDEEVALDASGTTEVHIDGDKLPKGIIDLRMEIVVTNASNETRTFQRSIYKMNRAERQTGDSLYRFVDRTDHFELKALVEAFEKRKCEAFWVAENGDTLQTQKISTANQFNWVSNAKEMHLHFQDPLMHNGVTYEDIVVSLSEARSLVFVNSSRSDTVCTFHLVNNRGLKVNYQLYEGVKLIETGVTEGAKNWSLHGKDKHGFTLRVSYGWAGTMHEYTKRASINTARLTVEVKAPKKSFPGNTETIAVDVKDYKGQGVADADVVAFGINDNFQMRLPDNFGYTSKFSEVDFTSSDIRELGGRFTSRTLGKEEVQKLQLDAQLYYQWMYPDSGYQVHPHLTSERTCFRIHALRNGVRKVVRVVYVDDVPVYINGLSAQQNIICDTEKHTLRIRLDYSEVVLKNIVLTADLSNEIVFDIERPSTNMEVIKMPAKLKGTERRLLNKYVLKISSHENILASSGDVFWPVSSFGSALIGPLAKGEKIRIHQKGKPSIDLSFNEYSKEDLLTLKEIKIKKKRLFQTYQSGNSNAPKNFFNSYSPLPNLNGSDVTPYRSPTYESVFEANGGAFAVKLPENKQWTWELNLIKGGARYNRSYASLASLGLGNTVKPGEYRLNASSEDEARVYHFTIKEGLLLNINETNESSFLKEKKSIQRPGATISGQAFEITTGGDRVNNFIVKGTGFYQSIQETLQRNGQYGFHIKVPTPNSYWLIGDRGDHLMAFDFNTHAFAEMKLVMGPTQFFAYDTLRYYSTLEPVLERSAFGMFADSTGINPYRGNVYNWDYGEGKMELLDRKADANLLRYDIDIEMDEIVDKLGLGSVSVPFLSISKDFIRTNFTDEAFWQPVLTTDAQGLASFKTTLPDDITKWKTYYYVFGPKRSTGFAKADINSSLPLSANLRTPRFFIEGDVSDISLQALNYTGDKLQVTEQLIFQNNVAIEAQVELDGEKSATHRVQIPSGTEEVTASYLLASENGFKDGEERSIPVYKQGIEEQVGHFKQVSKAESFTLDFDPSLGDITIYATPNPLPSLMKSLEGLKQYPHGCNEQLSSKLMAFLLDESITEANGDAKSHSFQIKRIIKKLEKNQNEFGAWTWYGTKGNTSDWVTLHVVKALAKAREIGYSVNMSQVQMEVLIEQQTSDLSKLRWMHAARKDVAPETLKAQLDGIKYSTLSTYAKLLYLDLSQKISEKDISVQLNALIQRTANGMLYCGSDQGKFYENNLVSTCLAFDMLKTMDDDEKLPQIAAYLLFSQRNGDWSNTLQKALILERLIPYYTKGEENLIVPASISVETVNGPIAIKHKLTVTSQSVLSFTKKGTTPLFLTAYQSSFNTAPSLKNDLANIDLTYTEKDKELSRLNAGTPVTMQCALEVKEKMEYCTLTLPIVAGCDYGSKVQGAYVGGLREVHREYFRNKVVLYFESIAPGTYSIDVSLEPRYSGSYIQNPSQLELMYFPTLSANNTLQRVEIAP